MSEPENSNSLTVEGQPTAPTYSLISEIDAAAVPPTSFPPLEAVVDRPNPEAQFKSKPMTPEQDARTTVEIIESALTHFRGDRKQTAAHLGITTEQLKTKIHYTASLRNKWKLPRGNIGTLKRKNGLKLDIKNPLPPIAPDDQAIARTAATGILEPEQVLQDNLRRQDSRLREAMKSLGLTESEVIDAMAGQQFHAKHYGSSVDITTAHTAINSIKIQGVLRVLEAWITKSLNDKIVQNGISPKQERKEEERRLKSVALIKTMLSGYSDLLKEARETAEMALHGAVIKARLNEMAKRSNVSTSTQAGKPKGAPGFNVKQKRAENTTQIITDHVTINNPPAEAPKVAESIPAAVIVQ